MCVAFGRQPNSVRPISDLQSERLEIRTGRILRVVHLKSSTMDSWDQGSQDEAQSTVSGESTNSNTVVVFFFHGVGGCADLWYEQLVYFSRAGYEVVAPDLLGHGESIAPRDKTSYNFSELSDDMITLFDRYRKKRNILVGHSYGASFCTVIATLRPRFVSKMVLVSGGGPTPLRPDAYHLFCLPASVLHCIQPLVLCTFDRRAYHRNTPRVLVKKYKSFSAPPYVLKATMEGQIWEEGDEAFHTELLVPALLIHGEQDNFVTLEEEQQMLSVIYSSSLEVVKDAGHMVMIECPHKVNRLIHGFLQRDPSTRSKESVHVRVASSTRQSLSVEALSEHEDFQGRRHSEGHLLDSTPAWINNAQQYTGTSLSVPENLGSTRAAHLKPESSEDSSIGAECERVSLQSSDGVNKSIQANKRRCEVSVACEKDGCEGVSRRDGSTIHSTSATDNRPSIACSAMALSGDSVKDAKSGSRRSVKSWFSPKCVRRKRLDHGSHSAPTRSAAMSMSTDSTQPKVEC